MASNSTWGVCSSLPVTVSTNRARAFPCYVVITGFLLELTLACDVPCASSAMGLFGPARTIVTITADECSHRTAATSFNIPRGDTLAPSRPSASCCRHEICVPRGSAPLRAHPAEPGRTPPRGFPIRSIPSLATAMVNPDSRADRGTPALELEPHKLPAPRFRHHPFRKSHR